MNSRDLMTRIFVPAMILKGHMDVKAMHRNARNGKKVNEKLLFKILRKSENSVYGKEYDFKNIKTIEDYRKKVPLTYYKDYEPYIERMINNEENVLVSARIEGYAQSSGSVGKRKFIPLTADDIRIYTKYTVTRMLALADTYHKKHNGRGLKPDRGMYTGPAYNDYLPNGLICSNVPDVAGRKLGFMYPYFINVPFKRLFSINEINYRYINLRLSLENKNTMFLFSVFFKDVCDYLRYLENNWEVLVDDIEKGKISDLAKASEETKAELLKVIRPMPERAAELRKEFEKGFDETIISRIWPNMSVFSGIGTSTFTPFSKLARKTMAGIPFDFGIYGASEGLFAACDELESAKQLLLTDSCYYEFIPIDDEDKIYSINELEIGKEYEIVITNQAGLYRYRCGDIIKVVDYLSECPYIQFSRRYGQLLNVTGEKTTEEHVAAAVKAISQAANCEVTDWVVCVDMDANPFRYILLIENKEGKDLSQYDEYADQALNKINARYEYFVKLGKIGKVTIRNLKNGTNKSWMKKLIEGGAPTTQVKPVRILDTPEKEEFFLKNML